MSEGSYSDVATLCVFFLCFFFFFFLYFFNTCSDKQTSKMLYLYCSGRTLPKNQFEMATKLCKSKKCLLKRQLPIVHIPDPVCSFLEEIWARLLKTNDVVS